MGRITKSCGTPSSELFTSQLPFSSSEWGLFRNSPRSSFHSVCLFDMRVAHVELSVWNVICGAGLVDYAQTCLGILPLQPPRVASAGFFVSLFLSFASDCF